MKEIELKKLRKRREKHFLQEDGTIIAKVYGEDVHFKKGNEYKEIDNTLVKENGYYTNNKNEYKVYFKENSTDSLMKVEEDNHFLEINLLDSNNVPVVKKDNISKLSDSVIYEEVLNGIDLEYKVMPTKVKENIIIKNKNFTPDKLCFSVKTNLDLSIEDKNIKAKESNKTIFTLEAPFMIDDNNNYNKEIYYNLIKLDEGYKLELVLDKKWLENAIYPVIIDPTITNQSQNNSVYDTYIYPGDANVDRNSQDVLKVGVERINDQDVFNRALIKFDLPTIGTGSQVIDAKLLLVGYTHDTDTYNGKIINVHSVTTDWDEETAKWETMNDKYNSRMEATFVDTRYGVFVNNDAISITENWVNCANITNLVRKWYSNTPNNGIMLKLNDEVYTEDDIPLFYSKNNTVSGDNPKPILIITYRNQNGLENYMDYKTQTFNFGKAYVNSYNGNLTTVFKLGNTIGGQLPANLNLIYNTNDVILNNNNGYGAGYKLDLYQTIKELTIEDILNLEYVDADGTIHYFREKNGEYVGGGDSMDAGDGITNKYMDEDGLNLIVEKNSSEYIMRDKNNNIKIFTIKDSIGYLTEIKDTSGNKINIYYNDDNTISKITDSNSKEINIVYEENRISIISPDETVYLNYTNNKITSINTLHGVINFAYNEKNIISSIEDTDGFKIVYEYYDEIPYRAKKISEYGLNNTLGQSLTISYGFDSTTITDIKNRIETMTFNVYGNLESKNNLKATGDVKNAYGKRQVYGESYTSAYGEHTRYKNKIISSSATNKYVKNYLKNTSFEGDNILFNASSNTELTIVGDMYESGIKSLKVVNTANNETITQEVSVPKGDNYTFSAYLKNSNKIRLALGYIDSSNELIENTSEIIDSTENFDRQDVTINYPEDANGNLIIKIYLDETGITYIDDIQLEEGEVANKYNMVENSDFSEGLTGWTLQCNKLLTGTEINQSDVFEIIDLPSNNKALKIAMNPANYSSFKKEFNINGFAGDTYNISFWYKDEGYVGEVGYGSSIINDTSIWFNYTDTSDGFGVFSSKIFTPNESEWQYFSGNFVALKDYDKMTLEFSQRFNANNFYITDICLFKDAREVNYDYDENGNIKFVHNLNNKTSTYNYDKNAQLINVVDYQNKDFTFEYDKNAPEKLLHGISNMGISSKLKYDEEGNPIYNSIKSISNNVSEGLYKIRLKGTDKFIGCINNSIHIKENCSHDLWKIEKVDDYYKISHSILYEKYLSVENSNLVLSSFNNDTSLFSLIRKEDGSYLVKMKNDDKYLNQSNDNVSISEIIEDDYNYEFFIEKMNSNIFVENNSQYSEDGRFIVSTTDTLLNKTLYNVDPNTGLLLSITNAKGHTINYNYDDCKKLISISEANKVVIYGYDSNNMLSTITQNNKQYKFSYDDFFRVKNVSLGENILFVTNNYESNNGNLNSMTFGNNQIISYSYDDFDRLICVRCMDDVYNYKYDNNGDLVKIISNDAVVKFVYNLAKELVEYRYNDFKIKYIYDVDDKIVETQYKLGDFTGVVGNVFNNDGEISSISFEGSNYNYNYDPLGRILSANINNKFNITYEYITNGNRTSFIIKKISIGEDIYLYKYDKLNNITHIYHNNKLENKYYYDEYNELIKENNYVNKTTTKYKYDICGNILSQKVYDLNNYNIISQKNYGYNNSNWEDQLTNFNDEIISYDEIGNPISIGEDTILTWINGRQLKSYEDSNNIITYKYNSDGIRIEKEVNNVKTHYYLQGEDIILEKNNNDVIYYIRNNMDGLVGFKYNNNLYYYLKNAQNDIIGILDNECNIVAKYTYDSWGNHVSIVDGNGNDVSNEVGHIANINSFRYRCYYYDKETGLYYLKLRYYNPKWGRFLNPDSILGANKDIISFNLYGYCSNNPIMYTDESGKGIFKSIVKTVKKAAKAVNKAVKKVVTVVKNVTKKVVNTVTNSVSKPAKAEPKKTATKTSPTPAKQEVDTSSLPDYTEELNKVLIANTAQAITISDSFSGKNALSYFYEQVKSGGPWDYKLKEKWEEDIDVPFLGYDGKFLYNGKVTSAEDFGNIHYGFVGTAMGMEPELLYMGGGYAAEGGFSIRMIIPPHYGDSENDHESIKRGIDMYYNWE